MQARIRAALIGTLLSMCAAQVTSAQVTIGTPNTTASNSYPFGSGVGFTEFQQLYSSSLFAGPLSINSLTFYNSRGTGNFQVGTFNLFLATTTATQATFSTNNPSANITSPLQAFATVTYGANTAAPPVFTFLGTSPFVYNPASGNLLLDIRFTPNGFNTNAAFLDGVAVGDPARSQLSTSSTTSAFLGTPSQRNFGLVTTFGTTTTVPEPGTYALMAAGLAGLFIARRRVRRAN